MTKQKHLPLERHREIGPGLAAVHHLLVEVANAYPKNSTTSRLAVRTFRTLETLRIQLYDNAIEENPGEIDPRDLRNMRDVYWPPIGSRLGPAPAEVSR